MNVSEILAKYPGLPTDLRAQLSAELAGMERDAGQFQYMLDYPDAGRALLSLLHEGKGTQSDFRNMLGRIMASRQAADSKVPIGRAA